VRQIETQPCGKARRGSILALFSLILLKFIYLAKGFIAPDIQVFINWFSQATSHHSPITYFQLKIFVKLHLEAVEPSMHSVLLFLDSLLPPCFYCIDHQKHLFTHCLWRPYWLNQSGNIECDIHIPLLWAFQVINAIVLLYIKFNVCHAIVCAIIWTIQVAIPVQRIFSVQNPLMSTITITFDWMIVVSAGLADI